MPVNTPHSTYAKHQTMWQKCRDAIAGEDEIKGRDYSGGWGNSKVLTDPGGVYLPPLEGMDSKEFNAYVLRSSFFGASHRTVEAMVGLVFRKPPQYKLPKEHEDDIKKQFGSCNESSDLFASMLLRELMTTGRVGALIDQSADGNGLPYAVCYAAEDIINWKEEMIEGKSVPVLVVLKEWECVPDPEDEFKEVKKAVYRVLRLVRNVNGEALTKAVYVQELWREAEQGSKANIGGALIDAVPGAYYIASSVVPKKVGGGTFDRIPFVCMGPDGIGFGCNKSPIIDLVNVNLSHYRNSADLEHGLHFTALPTAWAAGFTLQGTNKLTIGSQVAWTTDVPTAQAGYLEFTGAGLASIETRMDKKEKYMGVLGARLLEEQKKEAETAETLKIRTSGEQSVIGKAARSVSEGMTLLCKWRIEWTNVGSTDEVNVELNQRYNVVEMDPQMLSNLFATMQGGGMSFDTFFHKLNEAEMYPDGWTLEDERAAIEAGGPMSPAGRNELDAATQAMDHADAGEDRTQEQHDLAIKQGEKELKAPMPKG